MIQEQTLIQCAKTLVECQIITNSQSNDWVAEAIAWYKIPRTPYTSKNLPENLASFIDHTLLKPESTEADIQKLCQEAIEYSFKTICISPRHLAFAVAELRNAKLEHTVLPITVIGFPHGANTPESKLYETQNAIQAGAKEIDVVQSYADIKGQKYLRSFLELQSIATACKLKNVTTKVILETSQLTLQEKILSCWIARAADIQFLKTSTGFSSGGAIESDIRLMRALASPTMQVKASGGIRTREDAVKMILAGANRLGTSQSIAIVSKNTEGDHSCKTSSESY